MAEFVYVDNSNIFIEGKKIAAERNGDGQEIDFNFRLDFGELYDFVAEHNPDKIARALLLGSSPPTSDQVWSVAERVGFEVVVIDRNTDNREKKSTPESSPRWCATLTCASTERKTRLRSSPATAITFRRSNF